MEKNLDNQQTEAPQMDAQPARVYPPYEPPRAEVISFENDYVRAMLDESVLERMARMTSSGQALPTPTPWSDQGGHQGGWGN